MSRAHEESHDWLLIPLAGSSLVLASLFVLFGAEVMSGSLATLDFAVRRWTMDGREPLLIRFFRGVSFLGDKGPLIVLAIAIGWRLFPARRWWIPLVVLCAMASAAFVDWLKDSYQVIRPDTGRRTASSHSFPSGHASGSTAMSLFVAYLAFRSRVHPLLFAAVSALFVTLVGVSRIYLDRHWASDVVGGWVAGAMIGTTFCAAFEWIMRHQRLSSVRRKPPSPEGSTRI
jgi:membrane-associated phospholipid phosphatase